MPFLEFKCDACHVQVEQFYKTISEGEKIDQITCEACGGVAQKVPSIPLGFGLYGDPEGYSKPSPTKRHSTKTVHHIYGNDRAA